MASQSLSLFEMVNNAVQYCPTTGRFRWRVRADMSAQWNGRYAGKVAGSLTSVGYISIRLNNRPFQAHRLAWLLVHGSFPPDTIDHINRNRTDNRIANLRLATRQENNRNRNVRSDNTSGVTGVYWNKKLGKWAGSICTGGKRMHLGVFDTIEGARAAYDAAAADHFGEFAS